MEFVKLNIYLNMNFWMGNLKKKIDRLLVEMRLNKFLHCFFFGKKNQFIVIIKDYLKKAFPTINQNR